MSWHVLKIDLNSARWMPKLVSIDAQSYAALTSQSLRAAIGPLQDNWSLFHYVIGISGILPYNRNVTWHHSRFFPPSHGSIMLPPRQPHVFARLARWQWIILTGPNWQASFTPNMYFYITQRTINIYMSNCCFLFCLTYSFCNYYGLHSQIFFIRILWRSSYLRCMLVKLCNKWVPNNCKWGPQKRYFQFKTSFFIAIKFNFQVLMFSVCKPAEHFRQNKTTWVRWHRF